MNIPLFSFLRFVVLSVPSARPVCRSPASFLQSYIVPFCVVLQTAILPKRLRGSTRNRVRKRAQVQILQIAIFFALLSRAGHAHVVSFFFPSTSTHPICMGRSCNGVREKLIQCIAESKCMCEEGLKFAECIARPEISSQKSGEDCAQIRRIFADCKRGQVRIRMDSFYHAPHHTHTLTVYMYRSSVFAFLLRAFKQQHSWI